MSSDGPVAQAAGRLALARARRAAAAPDVRFAGAGISRAEVLAASCSAAEPRTIAFTRAPKSKNDHFAIVKRVIQVGTDSFQIDASGAWQRRTSVGCSSTRKNRHDSESLFEFFGEHLN